jgi:hypothetical protein
MAGARHGSLERMINMAQVETKVLTAHVPLPLAEKVDQVAARLIVPADHQAGAVGLARAGG